MKKLGRVLVWCMVIVLAIVAVLYFAVFDVWIVPASGEQTTSLGPTLSPGDVILVLRKSSLEGERLVQCQDPLDITSKVVARAYGYPGTKISIESELVVVDGKRWAPRESCSAPSPLTCASEFGEGDSLRMFWRDAKNPKRDVQAVVQPNELYLVSDNRHQSYDSRRYGTVALSTCRALGFRLWGHDREGRTVRFQPIP